MDCDRIKIIIMFNRTKRKQIKVAMQIETLDVAVEILHSVH